MSELGPDGYYQDVDARLRNLSNWGRWGAEDEKGTLNLISPAKRVGAAHSVSSGRVVSCSRPIPDPATAGDSAPMLRHTLRTGADAPAVGYGYAEEWIGLSIHGHSVTHLDAPSHTFWNRTMYNDRSADLVTTTTGAATNAVTASVSELVGRGVLLDAAAVSSRSWLVPGETVTVSTLEACEERQGVVCGEGDLLFIRTGRDRRASVEGPLRPADDGGPGLDDECVEWFSQRQIALFGTDVVAEARAAGQPARPSVHVLALVALGLWMIDNLALEELAAACELEQRWNFLAVICPLALQGSTGSPVNPLAVF